MNKEIATQLWQGNFSYSRWHLHIIGAFFFVAIQTTLGLLNIPPFKYVIEANLATSLFVQMLGGYIIGFLVEFAEKMYQRKSLINPKGLGMVHLNHADKLDAMLTTYACWFFSIIITTTIKFSFLPVFLAVLGVILILAFYQIFSRKQ